MAENPILDDVQNQGVGDDEIFARWVYQPRFMNDDEELIEMYVSLRENENGLSGMLLNRCSHDEVVNTGLIFQRKKKNGIPKEAFCGYCKACVREIRAIAEPDDTVDVVEAPSAKVLHHAVIVFVINGQHICGNTPHPRMRRYKEALLGLFFNDWVRV